MELISKKKLLETIEPMVGKFDDDGEFWWSRESILRAINNAPTVEERNEGEWLDNGDRYYRCSLCGMKDTDNWKFCRGCGAKMKGE